NAGFIRAVPCSWAAAATRSHTSSGTQAKIDAGFSAWMNSARYSVIVEAVSSVRRVTSATDAPPRNSRNASSFFADTRPAGCAAARRQPPLRPARPPPPAGPPLALRQPDQPGLPLAVHHRPRGRVELEHRVLVPGDHQHALPDELVDPVAQVGLRHVLEEPVGA